MQYRQLSIAYCNRNPMDVVNCPFGHKLHSDVNGALNIMRLGVKKIVNVLSKPFSFLV
jgi:putative transposase